MNKIAIIGRVAEGQDLYDGQTVLTRMFKEELEKQLNVNIYCVDTFEYKKNCFKCFFKTIYALLKCEKIFILLSKNGLSFYLPSLYYMNKIFRKKIYHRVIGGRLRSLVNKNKKWIKYINAMELNWVETLGMKNELIDIGIQNVEVSPNFKRMKILKKDELVFKDINDTEFNFCTFSRVTKEKGINDAIDAINCLYKKKLNVHLDIYGPIEEKYKDEFYKKIKDSNVITYKGIVDSKKTVDVIKRYYALLFPTFWVGEGFPGTIIDAFSAGVPVIASNWNYNSEIIKNNYTGIIYDINSKELLEKNIEYAINNEEFIHNMKFNCLKEAEKYDATNVIKELIKQI